MDSPSRDFSKVIKLIQKVYTSDERPFYLGFSGGKDSTALFAAMYKALIDLPVRRKKVVVLYCDTGVEIPVISKYVKTTLARIKKQAADDKLPIETKIVRPRLYDRFFLKLIGRGYPPPTNKFRWCTDRLRVGPVRREMQSRSRTATLMLLGTRWEESTERKRTLTRFMTEERHFFKQGGNHGTTVFAPLADLSTKQVWEFLYSKQIPEAIRVDDLSALYRSASGEACLGRCEDCLVCKSNRFGCWVCTVVRKDRAVFNMVNNGHPELAPLLEFRNWIAGLRDQPDTRFHLRRDGTPGLGPFTLSVREKILSRLMRTELQTRWRLILPVEVQHIYKCWDNDDTR